jgi:hypothetical protein
MGNTARKMMFERPMMTASISLSVGTFGLQLYMHEVDHKFGLAAVEQKRPWTEYKFDGIVRDSTIEAASLLKKSSDQNLSAHEQKLVNYLKEAEVDKLQDKLTSMDPNDPQLLVIKKEHDERVREWMQNSRWLLPDYADKLHAKAAAIFPSPDGRSFPQYTPEELLTQLSKRRDLPIDHFAKLDQAKAIKDLTPFIKKVSPKSE